MAFDFDTQGTVSVTNGSTEVTGAGTNWVATYPGLELNIDGLNYPVKSVNGRFSMTLVHPFPGETATDKTYTIVPVHPNPNTVTQSVTSLISTVNELIENGGVGKGKSAYELAVEQGFQGTLEEYLDSLKGRDGVDGSAVLDMASLQDLSKVVGVPVGSSAMVLQVPITTSNTSINWTQSKTMLIPKDATGMGTGIQITAQANSYAVTMGFTNAPEPQPEVPTEPIDLSGEFSIYAPYNAITPLGINLNNSTSTFSLSRDFTDAQMKVRRKVDTPIVRPTKTTWLTGSSGSPYPAVGDAVPTSNGLNRKGGGTYAYANEALTLNRDCYLITPKLNIEFPSSSDINTTQTPPWIQLGFKGTLPAGGGILGTLQDYGAGLAGHSLHWNNRSVSFNFDRANGGWGGVNSDEIMDLYGAEHHFVTRWENDVNGPGGTVTFYVDDVQYGEKKATESKPRISAQADFQVNASVENTANSIDGMTIRELSLELGKPDVSTVYNTIADGPVTRDDLENLVVDATGVTTQQPERTLSYIADGNQRFDLTVVVGEMQLPAGRPYKAVLMDFSANPEGVAHPNELVMTHPLAQNCRFEDDTLYGAQGAWTEVGPQGDIPLIDGIKYGCFGIRQGTYVMFQFHYWNDRPTEPFGDPEGLNTYMVPHKWYIYDSEGTLLHRVQRPNGDPLNGTSTKPVWEGQYDGRSIPIITDTNKWYPHGTTRTSVIYRNGKPPAYEQAFLDQNVPIYDSHVPFASNTGSSVNGYDTRFYTGSAAGEGQSNGFANWKVMPYRWGETTYESISQANSYTQDPYKNLYNAISTTPNAGLWLQYTPFNTMGRCPIVGPGGTRDDRQIMAEPVAQYIRDLNGKRPHDGTSMQDIALDFLTGYCSDPFNSVENGNYGPLYRSNARRVIGTRGHYYGWGDAARAAEQSFYLCVGRLYEWTAGQNPLRVKVPGNGRVSTHPYFGGFEIDNLHAHQFPHWGSLLFQTPEFAMIGTNFSDQSRMYNNQILGEWANSIASRENAWPFMHAALLWKTASSNSTRLYTRAQVLDWVVFDFETFYDRRFNTDPGFARPGTDIRNGQGGIDDQKAIYAGTARFGPCYYNEGGLELSEFQCGYWLSALHAAHKIGFLDALREASPKCEALVNWLITIHRKRIVGRINDAMTMNMYDSDYQVRYWKREVVEANAANISSLPKNFAEARAHIGDGPSWDTFMSSDNFVYSRDGQANDQLLAGPSILKAMGETGADLDAAETKAQGLFQQKYNEELARGTDRAGSEWYRYKQTTNGKPRIV
jgi:hypothetical protein